VSGRVVSGYCSRIRENSEHRNRILPKFGYGQLTRPPVFVHPPTKPSEKSNFSITLWRSNDSLHRGVSDLQPICNEYSPKRACMAVRAQKTPNNCSEVTEKICNALQIRR